MRNDIEKHWPYILGDLHEQALSEILSNDKALAFQKNCWAGIFTEGSPCCYCMNRGGRYTKRKAVSNMSDKVKKVGSLFPLDWKVKGCLINWYCLWG